MKPISTMGKEELLSLLNDLDFAECEMAGGFTSAAINELRDAAEARLEQLEARHE